MLTERVSIYTTKADDGGKKTTIVVDNMTEKTRQAIVAALYGIGLPANAQDISGYVSNAPTKAESAAMEEMDTDVSDMNLYASATDTQTAEDIADEFFDTNYDHTGDYNNYLIAVQQECINSAKSGNALRMKAMYIAADRILQADYSNNIGQLGNYLYLCSYMPLFTETFRSVAEQKGVYLDENAFSNSIATLLRAMTYDDMMAVVTAVERKY